jgi:hypothetical protein
VFGLATSQIAHEASRGDNGDEDPDTRATAIVHTLLHGIGAEAAWL